MGNGWATFGDIGALLFLSIAALFAPESAFATGQSLAVDLGTILGSEDFCGLTYDQAAIDAFIVKNVSSDDTGFASDLESMSAGTKVENEHLSLSEKTARCTQVRRTAKALGFTK